MISVFFVNNDGGGFADNVQVNEGTTIAEFVAAKIGVSANLNNYMIRVNRDVVARTYELQDGDSISLTPTKIAGA
jgi:molybdopterin converting factor small subunit